MLLSAAYGKERRTLKESGTSKRMLKTRLVSFKFHPKQIR